MITMEWRGWCKIHKVQLSVFPGTAWQCHSQRFPCTDFIAAARVVNKDSWPSDPLEKALYGDSELAVLCKIFAIFSSVSADIRRIIYFIFTLLLYVQFQNIVHQFGIIIYRNISHIKLCPFKREQFASYSRLRETCHTYLLFLTLNYLHYSPFAAFCEFGLYKWHYYYYYYYYNSADKHWPKNCSQKFVNRCHTSIIFSPSLVIQLY